MGEGEWHYVGSAAVNESENRIGIPDGIFEAGILSKDDRAYWAYENVVGFLVVSNRKLDDVNRYKNQGSRKIGSGKDGYRVTVPKRFFEDYKGKGEPVDEKARVSLDEMRYFVYQTPMAEGDTRSCYVLTKEQLENTISTPDEWAGSFDSIPRFMREDR